MSIRVSLVRIYPLLGRWHSTLPRSGLSLPLLLSHAKADPDAAIVPCAAIQLVHLVLTICLEHMGERTLSAAINHL